MYAMQLALNDDVEISGLHRFIVYVNGRKYRLPYVDFGGE